MCEIHNYIWFSRKMLIRCSVGMTFSKRILHQETENVKYVFMLRSSVYLFINVVIFLGVLYAVTQFCLSNTFIHIKDK